MTAIYYSQRLWTKTIRSEFFHAEKMLDCLFVKGVSKLACGILFKWWSKQQSALLGDLAQKMERFTYIFGHKPPYDNRSDSDRAESRQGPIRNTGHQRHDQRVINIEHLSPKRLFGLHSNRSTSSDTYETPVTMSMSGVVADGEPKEFNLRETTHIDSSPFYRFCLEENHKTSHCQEVKNIESFTQTLNRNFSYWRNRQTGARSVQHRQ